MPSPPQDTAVSDHSVDVWYPTTPNGLTDQALEALDAQYFGHQLGGETAAAIATALEVANEQDDSPSLDNLENHGPDPAADIDQRQGLRTVGREDKAAEEQAIQFGVETVHAPILAPMAFTGIGTRSCTAGRPRRRPDPAYDSS